MLATHGGSIGYLKDTFGILPSLHSAFVRLCIGVYGTFDASCMYIDTDDLADASGNIVALVVATFALFLLR